MAEKLVYVVVETNNRQAGSFISVFSSFYKADKYLYERINKKGSQGHTIIEYNDEMPNNYQYFMFNNGDCLELNVQLLR